MTLVEKCAATSAVQTVLELRKSEEDCSPCKSQTHTLVELLQSLPKTCFTHVWHIGTFNVTDRGQCGASFEGKALSVSRHPGAWRSIAKLGGRSCWRLNKADCAEGEFVDVLALTASMREAIALYGQDCGLLERVTRYKASYYDEEADTTLFSLYEDKEEALVEVEGYDNGKIIEESLLLGTTKLVSLTSDVVRYSPGSALDLALLALLENHPIVDGLWWEEVLDPHNLSAPRGCILQARVNDWTKTLDPSN